MTTRIAYKNLPPLCDGSRSYDRRAIVITLRDLWGCNVSYYYQAVQYGRFDWRLRPGYESGQAINAPGFNRLEAAADWARWEAEDKQRQYDNARSGAAS